MPFVDRIVLSIRGEESERFAKNVFRLSTTLPSWQTNPIIYVYVLIFFVIPIYGQIKIKTRDKLVLITVFIQYN
jgi:hypothetical protein